MEFIIVLIVLIIIAIIFLSYLFYKRFKDYKAEQSKINEGNVQKNNELNALLKASQEELQSSLDTMNEFIKELSDSLNQLNNDTTDKIDEVKSLINELDSKANKIEDNISSYKDSNSEELKNIQGVIDHNLEYTDNSINEKFSQANDKIDSNQLSANSISKDLLDQIKQIQTEFKQLKKSLSSILDIDEAAKTINDESLTDEGIAKSEKLINDAIAEIEKARAQNNKKPTKQIEEKKPESSESKKESKKDEGKVEVKPTNEEELAKNSTDNTEGELKPDKEAEETKSEVSSTTDDLSGNEIPSILDEYQRKAFNIMQNTNKNLVITGRAGTGKSTLITLFSRLSSKKILKLGPTGISALNIDGATLHSTFGYINLVNKDVFELLNGNIVLKYEKKKVLENVDTIIIDEISMLRSDVLEKIDAILKSINNNSFPFGGKQMILVGDPFQLPPVTKPAEEQLLNEKYDGIYFFNSNAYKKGKFNFVELLYNHRQDSDTKYYEILNHLREGKLSDDELDILNDRVCEDDDDELSRVIRLYSTKAEVESENMKMLDRIVGREHGFKCKILYSKYESTPQKIDSNFPFNETLHLKIGANVMFIYNDPDKKFVNGQIGIVKKILDDSIIVNLNGKEINVERISFSLKEANYVDGKVVYEEYLSVSQFPLVLSYAITIHKSQGQTYRNIAVDLTNCFKVGQEYVALSRVTSLNGLHLLKPLNTVNYGVDQEILNYYWDAMIESDLK